MNELKALEHPTLKVPYEVFNRKYRQAQRTLDLEARQISGAVAEIDIALKNDGIKAQDIQNMLTGMVEKLSTMKRKATEAISEEISAANVCKRRLEHLKEFADPDVTESLKNLWRKVRLDRMIIEYLLRSGYYGAARDLARLTNLHHLTDVDIYATAAEVENELENRQSGRCLQWCSENKTKLRKLNSTMEFNLRIQEFVELIRSDKRLDAVLYARRHLSNFEEGQLDDIQHCMGALAFPKDTDVEPYASLLHESRWADLVRQFRSEHARLLHPARPTLTASLHAGLAALKTPHCGSESSVLACPACAVPLCKAAACLPPAHCSHSRLFCRLTGEVLNEHNLPLVLPNGQVYGEKGLTEMMKEHGAIICPKTNELFLLKNCEKVFVM